MNKYKYNVFKYNTIYIKYKNNINNIYNICIHHFINWWRKILRYKYNHSLFGWLFILMMWSTDQSIWVFHSYEYWLIHILLLELVEGLCFSFYLFEKKHLFSFYLFEITFFSISEKNICFSFYLFEMTWSANRNRHCSVNSNTLSSFAYFLSLNALVKLNTLSLFAWLSAWIRW